MRDRFGMLVESVAQRVEEVVGGAVGQRPMEHLDEERLGVSLHINRIVRDYLPLRRCAASAISSVSGR